MSKTKFVEAIYNTILFAFETSVASVCTKRFAKPVRIAGMNNKLKFISRCKIDNNSKDLSSTRSRHDEILHKWTMNNKRNITKNDEQKSKDLVVNSC